MSLRKLLPNTALTVEILPRHLPIHCNRQHAHTQAQWIYSVSQENPPYGFLKFIPKRLGIFNQFFYTPIILSFLQ